MRVLSLRKYTHIVPKEQVRVSWLMAVIFRKFTRKHPFILVFKRVKLVTSLKTCSLLRRIPSSGEESQF